MRTIAVVRITMPASAVRLSAEREDMSEEMQAFGSVGGKGFPLLRDLSQSEPFHELIPRTGNRKAASGN